MKEYSDNLWHVKKKQLLSLQCLSTSKNSNKFQRTLIFWINEITDEKTLDLVLPS